MIGVHGGARRRGRWWALIVMVKVLVVAGLVILPAEFTVALGAAHGVALAVGVSVAGAVLVVRWRHRSAQAVSPDRGHGRRHDQDDGQDRGPDHERGHGGASVPEGGSSRRHPARRERGAGR